MDIISLKFDILTHRQKMGLLKIIFNYLHKFSCNLNFYELLKTLFALTECSEGYYGHNCEEPCSLTCKDQGRYDGITGSCYSGCMVGLKGKLCEHGKSCVKNML